MPPAGYGAQAHYPPPQHPGYGYGAYGYPPAAMPYMV